MCLSFLLAGNAAGFSPVPSRTKLLFVRYPGNQYVLSDEQPVLRATTATLEDEETAQTVECIESRKIVHVQGDAQQSQFATENNFHLPRWLERYAGHSSDDAEEEIRWLEYALLERGFAIKDIQDIVQDIQTVSLHDAALIVGMVDFLKTILSLREVAGGSQYFVTTPVMRAAIIHYSDCVVARRKGVPDLLRKFLRPDNSKDSSKPCLPAARCSPSPEQSQDPSINLLPTTSMVLASTSHSNPNDQDNHVGQRASLEDGEDNQWDLEVMSIVQGAARIKEKEFLVQAVLQSDSTAATHGKTRDLLLSMTEDWRSLGIRVVASLYRLDGLLEQQQLNEYTERTPEIAQTAREALRIYAPLAQRLGLYMLKARIESQAFRLLYRRQYDAAMSLYAEGGQVMKAISVYLLSDISRTLRSDAALMDQLEDLQVVSRVKEPYSFWRKLLKSRIKGTALPAVSSASDDTNDMPRTLALTQVNDGVALRVILKAKKDSPDETDEDRDAREKLLCYYVQQVIRRKWPEINHTRLKDYISHPKPNGYQSLHHTSKISSRGLEFPFEVQVRSQDMHNLAEFGFAAHWDYKLGSSSKPLLEGIKLESRDKAQTSQAIVPASSSVPGMNNAYIEALFGAKEALSKSQVYVFLLGKNVEKGNGGELVSVPANSLIADVVQEIESSVASKVQVWRNGRLADKSEKLENGDVVMIAL